MFIEKPGIKKKFRENGFVILDTTLNLNPNFKNILTKVYKDINFLLSTNNYKKYGGFMMGNFGINQGPLGKKLFSLIFQKDFLSLLQDSIKLSRFLQLLFSNLFNIIKSSWFFFARFFLKLLNLATLYPP